MGTTAITIEEFGIVATDRTHQAVRTLLEGFQNRGPASLALVGAMLDQGADAYDDPAYEGDLRNYIDEASELTPMVVDPQTMVFQFLGFAARGAKERTQDV